MLIPHAGSMFGGTLKLPPTSSILKAKLIVHIYTYMTVHKWMYKLYIFDKITGLSSSVYKTSISLLENLTVSSVQPPPPIPPPPPHTVHFPQHHYNCGALYVQVIVHHDKLRIK
jgi:hypothetical protein